ncbi:ribonuclease P subunit P14 [Corchorus olitorius]|uniref:Ribonuclease P subunit P14 n=1 Tax=Corchorus olitorius TaxID=93759 RepID=A0A1R3KNF2_9ROSI|nr:ribonuclease P subunit P14 [Corchorus olitorius]
MSMWRLLAVGASCNRTFGRVALRRMTFLPSNNFSISQTSSLHFEMKKSSMREPYDFSVMALLSLPSGQVITCHSSIDGDEQRYKTNFDVISSWTHFSI